MEVSLDLRDILRFGVGAFRGTEDAGRSARVGGHAVNRVACPGERRIERGFRVEIDALERALLFWTVWVPPALVLLAGFVFLLLRRRRPR